MEYLESGESVKEQLREKAARRRQQFQEEARSLTTRAEKVLTNGLIIAGALAVTYWVFIAFSGGKKKKRKTEKSNPADPAVADDAEEESTTRSSGPPGLLAGVGSALATQAGLFLLDLAKEKLREYLASRQRQEESNEDT